MTAASRHVVRRAEEARFIEIDAAYRRWSVVDETTPAVHTGFGLCELDGGGRIGPHVHSYEESFFVLEGEAVVQTSEGEFAVVSGDYGVLPVGVRHAWGNAGTDRARWADMLAPQPRAHLGHDTVALAVTNRPNGSTPIQLDVRDPRTRSFGHIDPAHMDVDHQTQDRLAVSASMRSALLVYSGISVKMMVDTDLGAQLSTMFMVQYESHGFAGAHDHPFEETYLILDGEVDAAFDDVDYRLCPGDVAFAGVGCVHRFANASNSTVRWLETQAPQPPARHSYRFARDWDYLRTTTKGG